jgi:predicted RNA binding protein YcfA (HicA-like mRNA interferase family)
MNVRQIIKRLEADGWRLVRQRGSHRQFKHPVKPGTLAIEFHLEGLRLDGSPVPRPSASPLS